MRSPNAKANDFDVYGLRPMTLPWAYLCPHEFFREWKAEPLLSPLQYERRGEIPRSEWTRAGRAHSNVCSSREAAVTGLHYVVVSQEDPRGAYHSFPDTPTAIYNPFRHPRALVRRNRPVVVCIEGMQVPRANRSAEENAMYFSLFFRPWCLTQGTADVTHISLLGLRRVTLEKVYAGGADFPSRRSTTGKTEARGSVDFSASWSEYIHGNVVSKSA